MTQDTHNTSGWDRILGANGAPVLTAAIASAVSVLETVQSELELYPPEVRKEIYHLAETVAKAARVQLHIGIRQLPHPE